MMDRLQNCPRRDLSIDFLITFAKLTCHFETIHVSGVTNECPLKLIIAADLSS